MIAADGSIEGLRCVPVSPASVAAEIRRVQFDADAWPFGPGTFDLILQTDFLDRGILPEVLTSVRPGGLILIDTFAGPGGPGTTGPSNPAYRLRAGELTEHFADWEVLEHACTDGREAILARAPRRAV